MCMIGPRAPGKETILLKYGVLGLLIERRGYGYELVQRLTQRLGAAWQLNPSAVYTALDHLESDELIRGRWRRLRDASEHVGARRGERVIYEATDQGADEFERWFGRPSVRVDPIRSEIQLKVALAGPDNIPPLLASIAQEEWIMRRMQEECRAGTGGVHGREAAAPSQGERWSDAAAVLVNAAADARLAGQLAWMASVRETLQQLSAVHLNALGGVETPSAGG